MKRKMILAVFLLLVSLPLLISEGLKAASFECSKAATKIEKMICTDKELSELDEQLQTVYQDVYKNSADPARLKMKQRQWLKARELCQSAHCLIEAYNAQLASLQAILTEPTPCFRLLERKWPEVASGHYPVCVEFLKNINRFCGNLPICDWKVDPSIKTLSLPQWKEINPKEYLKVIQHMFQRYFKDREEQWIPIPPETMQRITEGKTRLWHAWVDLDRDGQKEHVVRFDGGPCNMQGVDFFGLETRIAVVDASLSRVDPRYQGIRGAGVIIYDGLAYLITRDGDGFDLQEPFTVGDLGEMIPSKGMESVCVFDFLKK